VISCPTASIGVSEPATRAELKETISDFPVELADGVHHCGFHAESSFGATSYFIRREDGNVLVDSPRFAAPLVKRIKDLGGVRWMFLTHQDDVADHAKWAAEFGCERIIHEGDARALNAEIVLHGNAEHVLAPGLTIIPTPGHTRGSACLHYNDRFLFTGDHMAYSRRLEHLYAFKSACWYDWGKLVKSLHRLAPLRFEWVLPGHGWPLQASAREMEVHMQACLKWAEG
jgi:glyoxylase-like metal-dependent hydrolase (beta-lactamase superfamily II)